MIIKSVSWFLSNRIYSTVILPVSFLSLHVFVQGAEISPQRCTSAQTVFSETIRRNKFMEDEGRELSVIQQMIACNPLCNARYSLAERILIGRLARDIMREFGPKLDEALAQPGSENVVAVLEQYRKPETFGKVRPADATFDALDIQVTFWTLLTPTHWKKLYEMKRGNTHIFLFLDDIGRNPVLKFFSKAEAVQKTEDTTDTTKK